MFYDVFFIHASILPNHLLFVKSISNLFLDSSGITGMKLGRAGITMLCEGAEGTYIIGGKGGRMRVGTENPFEGNGVL